jgi:phage shock protein C
MFCTKCGKQVGSEAGYCAHCGAYNAAATAPFAEPEKRLMRSRRDRKIAGVCAGVASYLGLDPTMVRIVWLLCVLLGGSGVLAYAICWVLIPEE